jgi:hypothetical protein
MSQKLCRVKCTDGELSVKPFRLKLVVKKKNGSPDDEGAWVCDDGDLDIFWNKGGGKPWGWSSDTVARGTEKNYGAPSNKNGATHRYTVVIKVPGQPPITIDPEVVVSEGGPPDGGKKKAAKKKR